MSAAATSLTVRVPLAIRRRGGRKVVIAPLGTTTTGAPFPTPTRADPTLVKALARAHRWQAMLDAGRYASLSELAAAERIDRGYLGRLLQLTLLAPDLIEAILDGRGPEGVGLPRLLEPFPSEWAEQHSTFRRVS